MCVEIVLNQEDGLCFRILIGKQSHKIRVINHRPAFLDANQPLTCERFKGQKNAACAISDVFIMLFLWTPRLYWNRDNSIADKLTWPLIKTDNRMFRIIGLLIEIQDILHTPDELTRHLSDAPASF